MPNRRTKVETLGERIKRLRAACELSQSQLAALVGVEHGTLSRWERGENRPRNAAIRRRLAEALGVSVGELLGASAQASPSPVADRRLSVLAPLRGAVSRVQAAGDEALADFVAAVVVLADSRWRARRG